MRFSRPPVVPLIVACALFMENMDATVIATSLPSIARALGESPIALKLALTSYLVSLAVFIPISSWMADRFGSRTVFRAAIGVFMLGSVLCGISDSLGGFVLARFVQGMGGAMMVPVGRLVLLKSVEKRDLVNAFAWLTLPALVGPVIGPPLGGFITTYWDWRWIFFLNLPIGVLGVVLATRYIPEIREPDVAPLDAAGFMLSGVGLSTLVLGLATAGQHLLSARVSVACVIVGMAMLAWYLRHMRRTPRPVLDLRFLAVPTYRVGVVGGSLFRVGVGATPFLLPLMLQLGLGFNALQSGLLTCLSAIAAMFMKTLTTRILRRFGFRQVLVVNGLLASGTIAACGLFSTLPSFAVICTVLFVGGFFRSLEFTALNAVAFADIDRRDMGPASGVSNVAQQLALSAGVTIGAYALQFAALWRGHADVMPTDFTIAFVIVGAIAAMSSASAFGLAPDAGAVVSGRVEAAREAD